MILPALLGCLLPSGDWSDIRSDAALYATAPARWEARDWGLAAGAVGLTALLVPLADRPVQEWMQGHQDPAVSRGADFVRQAGNGWYTVPLLGGLWGTGWALESPREQRAAREATEALVLSAVVSQAVKYSAGRKRPFATDDPWDWGSTRGAEGKSFVSGHSQAAWSVLTVIGLEYRNVPAVAPLAFGLAGACSVSRLYDDKHWTSDVVAGSLLGFASGYAVVRWNRDRAVQVAPQGVTFRTAF